jgi:hypothetical protein
MRHPAVLDMATRLHYLEPADLAQRARRTANRIPNRILKAFFLGTSDLDESVNVIGHRSFLPWLVLV